MTIPDLEAGIASVLFQNGPATCDKIAAVLSIRTARARTLLVDMMDRGIVTCDVTTKPGISGWMHLFSIKEPFVMPKLSPSEYLQPHHTGTEPEKIRRLIK